MLTDLPCAAAQSGPTGTPSPDLVRGPAEPLGRPLLSLVPSHGWLERVDGRQNTLTAIRFHLRRDCEHIVNPHSLLEMAVWCWDAARCEACAKG